METKTIEQIADDVCAKKGIDSIDKVISLGRTPLLYGIMKEVAQQYAYEKCEEQKQACSQKAKTKIVVSPLTRDEQYVTIDRQSILNTPNVCNPKTN